MKRLNATPRSLAQWIIDEGMSDEMQILVASVHHFTPKTVVECIDEAMEIVKAHNAKQVADLKLRIRVKRGRRELVHGLVRVLRSLRIQQLALEIRRRKHAA